jgi:hypothetical protein
VAEIYGEALGRVWHIRSLESELLFLCHLKDQKLLLICHLQPTDYETIGPVSDTSRPARLALIHLSDSLSETVGTQRFALSSRCIEVFQIMSSAAGAEHPGAPELIPFGQSLRVNLE